MPDIADTEYQDEQSQEIEQDGLALELAVLAIIAARLGKVDKNTTYSDARLWLNADMEKIERLFYKYSTRMTKHSDSIMDEMAAHNDEWAKEFYAAKGIEQVKVKDSDTLGTILNNGKTDTNKGIKAIINTNVAGIVDNNGNFISLREGYIATINEVITAMTAGEATYQQAISKAVTRLSNYGLRVQYASGLKRELYAAVRTNVMDGYRQTMQDLRTQQGKEFGADGVEISTHGQCAPDHLPYQGRQYTNDEFEQLQRKLDRPIGGVNCRHITYPIVMGVSSKKYTSKQLAEIKKNSTRKVTFKGLDGKERTMTAYEATQYQRTVEATIRKQRMKQYIGDSAKVDTSKQKENISRLTKEYKRMSKEMGLSTRMERTKLPE